MSPLRRSPRGAGHRRRPAHRPGDRARSRGATASTSRCIATRNRPTIGAPPAAELQARSARAARRSPPTSPTRRPAVRWCRRRQRLRPRLDAVVNNASRFATTMRPRFGFAAMDAHWRVNTAAPSCWRRRCTTCSGRARRSGCVVNLLDQKLWNPNPDFFPHAVQRRRWSRHGAAGAWLRAALRSVGVAPGVTLTSDMSDASSPRAPADAAGRSSTPEDVRRRCVTCDRAGPPSPAHAAGRRRPAPDAAQPRCSSRVGRGNEHERSNHPRLMRLPAPFLRDYEVDQHRRARLSRSAASIQRAINVDLYVPLAASRRRRATSLTRCSTTTSSAAASSRARGARPREPAGDADRRRAGADDGAPRARRACLSESRRLPRLRGGRLREVFGDEGNAMSAVLDDPGTAAKPRARAQRASQQARQAPAPPGRPGHRRLQHDRGRRQGDGLPVRRQGQLRAAGHPAHQLQPRAPVRFELVAVNLDQKQPGFPEHVLPEYLARAAACRSTSRTRTPTRSSSAWSPRARRCAACARGCAAASCTAWPANSARPRSRSATTATTWLQTLFMNMFFGSRLKGMPPKLVSDDGKNIVIRPLAYVAETDLERWAAHRQFPIIPCSLCGNQENLQRVQMKKMLREWERQFPGRLDNIFTAMGNIVPSHMMDRKLYLHHAEDHRRGQPRGRPDPSTTTTRTAHAGRSAAARIQPRRLSPADLATTSRSATMWPCSPSPAQLAGCAAMNSLRARCRRRRLAAGGRSQARTAYAFERLPRSRPAATEPARRRTAARRARGSRQPAECPRRRARCRSARASRHGSLRPWDDPFWWRGGLGLRAPLRARLGSWGASGWGLPYPRLRAQVAVLILDRPAVPLLRKPRQQAKGLRAAQRRLGGCSTAMDGPLPAA